MSEHEQHIVASNMRPVALVFLVANVAAAAVLMMSVTLAASPLTQSLQMAGL
jgi:hypothetical protein